MATDGVTFGVGWGLRLSASRDVELSILAEELGLDGVWYGEHPTARFAGYEPHIVLTYIAAKTERIKLGTAAYLLPLSHPVRLAKQLTTLDHLSNGRVILGGGLRGRDSEAVHGLRYRCGGARAAHERVHPAAACPVGGVSERLSWTFL